MRNLQIGVSYQVYIYREPKAQVAGVVEYPHCISAEGYDPTNECPNMTQIHQIVLGDVGYHFIAITARSTLTRFFSTCSVSSKSERTLMNHLLETIYRQISALSETEG